MIRAYVIVSAGSYSIVFAYSAADAIIQWNAEVASWRPVPSIRLIRPPVVEEGRLVRSKAKQLGYNWPEPSEPDTVESDPSVKWPSTVVYRGSMGDYVTDVAANLTRREADMFRAELERFIKTEGYEGKFKPELCTRRGCAKPFGHRDEHDKWIPEGFEQQLEAAAQYSLDRIDRIRKGDY